MSTSNTPGAMSVCTCSGGKPAPFERQRLLAFAQPQRLQGLRRNPGAARRAEKLDDLLDRQCLPGHRGTGRQRHRLDAHQLQALVFMPLERHPPLQHRRHRPAGAAQFDKQLLGEGRAARVH